MKGDQLLGEISRRIMSRNNVNDVTDAMLASELGVTQPALANYRGRNITPRQVANLMEKYARATKAKFVGSSIDPIVEFFPLSRTLTNHGMNWQLFSATNHPYRSGLRRRLEVARGVYIFHDSRGRAIYVGKADQTSLWAEMNNVFNRDRGAAQTVRRVQHPNNRVQYRGLDEIARNIVREPVLLADLASYVSAYQIPSELIGTLEALMVRSFANDLLNIRMEGF